MITDYIGGEGAAETPKNDYVIYGWPLTTVCSAGNGLRGRGPNWFTNHLLFTKWFLDLWFEELYSTWQTKQINKSFAIYNIIIIADLNHLPLEMDAITGFKVFCAVSSLMFWVECHRVSDQRKESVAFQQFGQQGTLSLSLSALAT